MFNKKQAVREVVQEVMERLPVIISSAIEDMAIFQDGKTVVIIPQITVNCAQGGGATVINGDPKKLNEWVIKRYKELLKCDPYAGPWEKKDA